jgi:hypothetical protein
MNYALIKSGLVENVIIADAAFIDVIRSEWDHIVDITDTGYGKGWLYDGEEFTLPVVEEPPVVEELTPMSTEGLLPIPTNTK